MELSAFLASGGADADTALGPVGRQMLQMTLVENREDRDRYAVIVSYENRMTARIPNPVVVAVRREWAWLDTGRGWRWTVVRVTELREPPGLRGREWPRKIDRPYEETEEIRRARITALRARCHVDPAKGRAEPDWDRAAEAYDHMHTVHADQYAPTFRGQPRCTCVGREQGLATPKYFAEICGGANTEQDRYERP